MSVNSFLIFFFIFSMIILLNPDDLCVISRKIKKYFILNVGLARWKKFYCQPVWCDAHLREPENSATESNPAKPDKSLYAGIIYAGIVYNSATQTNEICFF